MRRLTHLPRSGWQARVESVGLPHHTAADGAPYWDESASYVLAAAEVDVLEAATNELHQLCLAAVAHVVAERRWAELAIPPAAAALAERSWRGANGAAGGPEPTLYGRFDLAYDGASPPRLLEYNADTPTALVEAAVAQWYWLQDVDPAGDQFNSIHERLVAAWPGVVAGATPNAGPAPPVHFAAADDVEDAATTTYLRDTAEQGGLRTRELLVGDVGWDAARRRFVDLDEVPIAALFKLYPWEWMVRDAFGAHLLEAAPATRWVEPPWKMVLSNKGILPILWELFPGHPNLLPAYFDPHGLEAYARKPRYSREGANVSLVMFGDELARSGGDYGAEGYVYQALAPVPQFDGRTPVLGAWVVAGEAAGVGVREDDGPITTNLSRFVPHRMA